MLIEKIDAVGAKALERPLDSELDVLGSAVEPRESLTGLQINVPAEFRGDHDLVAEGLDTLAQYALALKGAISFRRVKECYAAIVGGADDVDHLRAVGHCSFILAAHILDAQPDAGDLQFSQCATADLRRSAGPALHRRLRKGRRDDAAVERCKSDGSC